MIFRSLMFFVCFYFCFECPLYGHGSVPLRMEIVKIDFQRGDGEDVITVNLEIINSSKDKLKLRFQGGSSDGLWKIPPPLNMDRKNRNGHWIRYGTFESHSVKESDIIVPALGRYSLTCVFKSSEFDFGPDERMVRVTLGGNRVEREDFFSGYLRAEGALISLPADNCSESFKKAENSEINIPIIRDYTVCSGDTGYKIARIFYMSFSELKAINPDTKWESLQIGEKIKIRLPGMKKIFNDLSEEKLLSGIEKAKKVMTKYCILGGDGKYYLLEDDDTYFVRCYLGGIWAYKKDEDNKNRLPQSLGLRDLR